MNGPETLLVHHALHQYKTCYQHETPNKPNRIRTGQCFLYIGNLSDFVLQKEDSQRYKEQSKSYLKNNFLVLPDGMENPVHMH
jgi:hypothetical protein